MRRWTVTIAACALVALAACSAERDREYQTAVDTLTRRQKDSLISTMPIPGAGAVGRALETADRAGDRAISHDTVR